MQRTLLPFISTWMARSSEELVRLVPLALPELSIQTVCAPQALNCGLSSKPVYWFDTKTSHSFVYNDPVGRSSLLIKTTDSTPNGPNDKGRSITPSWDNV